MLGPTAAWGLWSDDTPLEPVSVAAGEVAPAEGLTCSTEGGLLGLVNQYVVLRWQEPETGPPERYLIRAQADGETYTLGEVGGDTRRFEISTGLLSVVVEGLLSLILGGRRPPITVVAVHGSGWESVSTDAVPIRVSVLGLGGLRCA